MPGLFLLLVSKKNKLSRLNGELSFFQKKLLEPVRVVETQNFIKGNFTCSEIRSKMDYD
jgi:hypothetical protein